MEEKISFFEDLLSVNGVSKKQFMAYLKNPQESPLSPDKLDFVEKAMNFAGVTIKALRNAWNVKPTMKLETFPFEVIYTDGCRCRRKLDGKYVWGVIVNDYAISLYRPKKKMAFKEAKSFCSGLVLTGEICTPGDRVFWNQVLSLKDSEREALDKFITCLGGEPLNKECFWVDSCFKKEDFWSVNLKEKDFHICPFFKKMAVCPILKLK